MNVVGTGSSRTRPVSSRARVQQRSSETHPNQGRGERLAVGQVDGSHATWRCLDVSWTNAAKAKARQLLGFSENWTSCFFLWPHSQNVCMLDRNPFRSATWAWPATATSLGWQPVLRWPCPCVGANSDWLRVKGYLSHRMVTLVQSWQCAHRQWIFTREGSENVIMQTLSGKTDLCKCTRQLLSLTPDNFFLCTCFCVISFPQGIPLSSTRGIPPILLLLT